jgi:hypothetical protein
MESHHPQNRVSAKIARWLMHLIVCATAENTVSIRRIRVGPAVRTTYGNIYYENNINYLVIYSQIFNSRSDGS